MSESTSTVDRAADVLAGHDVSHPDLHSGLGVAIICQCGARVAQTEGASWPVAHRAHVAEALRLAGLLRDAPAMTTETSSRHWLIMYDGDGDGDGDSDSDGDGDSECDCAIGDDHGPYDPIPAERGVDVASSPPGTGQDRATEVRERLIEAASWSEDFATGRLGTEQATALVDEFASGVLAGAGDGPLRERIEALCADDRTHYYFVKVSSLRAALEGTDR